jgi:hypothetical protein
MNSISRASPPSISAVSQSNWTRSRREAAPTIAASRASSKLARGQQGGAIAPCGEDVAPAAFQLGHRVALAAAAEDAIAQCEDRLGGFDGQIAHQWLLGQLADQLAALHDCLFSRPVRPSVRFFRFEKDAGRFKAQL